MLKPKDIEDELPGFQDSKSESVENVSNDNKKKKKGSGGFQSMGFSFPILKGITKRGYKQPTPIQRKVRLVEYITSIVTYYNIIYSFLFSKQQNINIMNFIITINIIFTITSFTFCYGKMFH